MSTNLHGTVIDGRYEVISRIARGGMATVYLAHDRRLDRDVAVKVMHPHLAESEAFNARFRREARAAAGLGHPNAVAVFDQGTWEDSLYLTMEYVDGEDLRDLLRREGAIPLGRALETIESVLDALSAAHRRNLIHRDIKPENVLCSADGTPKLADFGLARAVSDATQASTGTVLGTVAYLAPELVTAGTATAASDVYAVGVMLFEMLTGRQPFFGDIPINVAFQHVTSSVPLTSSLVPGIPREVDDLVAALTARDVSERLPDGDAALSAVRRVLEDLSPESATIRADVPGAPDQPVNQTAEDPDRSQDPHGTAPIAVKPSSGTAAIPIGEAPPATPAPIPAKRRTRSILIALLLLLITAGGAFAYYALLGPGAYTQVPSVVALQREDALDILRANDLVPAPQDEYSDTVPTGIVIRTEPGSGENVRKNSEVIVVVSQGMLSFEMPAVVGLPYDDAILALGEFPEPTVIEEYSQDVPLNEIIAVTIAGDVRGPDGETFAAGDVPEPGTLLPHTIPLELRVSLGREPVTAPRVVESTLDDAIAALSEAGLVGTEAGERAFHDSIPEGSVISQDHEGPGLLRGDTVTLTVSKGPELVEVPQVVWKSQQDAEELLKAAGLTVKVEAPLGVILNTVRTQSERAGTMVPRDTVVTIQVI